MRFAYLTGVAALLSVAGAAAAQAEMVYVDDGTYVGAPTARYVTPAPGYVATTPGYVYSVPAPPFGPFTPRYVVTEPAPAYVAEPPMVVAPPRVVTAPTMASPPRSGVVTTGYSTGSCFIDLAGIERCY